MHCTGFCRFEYCHHYRSGIIGYPSYDLQPGQWERLTFRIPAKSGVCLEQAGIEWVPQLEYRRNLALPAYAVYIDDLAFCGLPDYELDFTKETIVKWNALHTEVSQLSYLRGIWTLEDGELSVSYAGEPAEAYTGNLKWTDLEVEAVIVPKKGNHHNVNFRVQGAIRSYAAGLGEGNRLVLYKNDNGYRELASVPFEWRHGQAYKIMVKAEGSILTVSINDTSLTYDDGNRPYLHGMVGFSSLHASHTHYRSMKVKGI